MIGTAIKNTILFVLIIFILHFLIKNILFDRTNTVTAPEAAKETMKTLAQQREEEKEAVPAPVEVGDAIISKQAKERINEPLPTKERDNSAKEREELLKYVFGGDADTGDSDAALAKFFPENKELAHEQEMMAPIKACPMPKKGMGSLPVVDNVDAAGTATAACEFPPLNPAKDVEKPVVSTAVKQTLKDQMIINEYGEENDMNTMGSLTGMNGLHAYDDQEHSYESYDTAYCEATGAMPKIE